MRLPPSATPPPSYHPFTAVGIDWHAGLNGVGFDVATPLEGRFNLRIGFDFFDYTTSFQEQGANISATLHMRASHASLDWFPFGGKFHVSPLFEFANNNRVQATAIIPAGSTITVNGQDYESSSTNPLEGNGEVSFRRVAPGLTAGFGNIIPRANRHLSLPVEAGFYYVGQPRLKVNFQGTACDPDYPPAEGCMVVAQNPGFQQNLAAFIARNNHNLSYASFFPVLSFGVGYSF
ncbi:hypothetical protein [Granulicella arctica]|uniref:Outer membrane protein beta-barrel domain-containing protein n=1 Tax=Granulicella arctica TaxID=940613 RepID=A0A7Y9PJ05_9BACT|nr:hypothetical protein [Granulicella arctica]NYF80798.1 hypothetical protein [Granulicella arctica]